MEPLKHPASCQKLMWASLAKVGLVFWPLLYRLIYAFLIVSVVTASDKNMHNLTTYCVLQRSSLARDLGPGIFSVRGFLD